MKKTLLISLVAALAVLSACKRGELAPITRDDTPDLKSLIQPHGDAAATAGQVGEPATLLLMAQDQGERVRADVAGILDFLDKGTDRDPDVQGEDVLGQPFGRWTYADEASGNTVHIVAIRTAENRVRIIVQGENADGLSLPLLTGVFVKHSARRGGGRFHLSFSNYSDLFAPEGQGADGSIHFLFANSSEVLHGRRVAYLGVDDRATADADAQTFAADLVRLPGVGGRYRSIYAADLIGELEGLEAVGMRTAWLDAIGGRSDVVVATQANGGQIIGIASECWDQAGLRTAYGDTMADNDNVDPNAGDVSNCHDLVSEPADENAVQGGGDDVDEELDAALDEAGANDVGEDEAEDAEIPEAQEE